MRKRLFRAFVAAFLAITLSPPSNSFADQSLPKAESPAPEAMWLVDYGAMIRALEFAGVAWEAERFEEAGIYFGRAGDLATGIPGPIVTFNDVYAARAYSKAGKPDRALAFLQIAAQRGFRDPEFLNGEPSFDGLRDTRAFQWILYQ